MRDLLVLAVLVGLPFVLVLWRSRKDAEAGETDPRAYRQADRERDYDVSPSIHDGGAGA